MMTDVTQVLLRIQHGEAKATDELLPLVYDELRRLAAYRLGSRRVSESLQATELVHEAYIRLVHEDSAKAWDGRGHFFAAAAEAMRRIIVDRVRSRAAQKRGKNARRVEMAEGLVAADKNSERLLELNEALAEMECQDKQAATLVKLRYFVGMQHQEAADVMGLSRRQADRIWLIAKTWLYKELGSDSD